MKPLALTVLCFVLVALGIAQILAAWLLLKIFPLGLVVLILSALILAMLMGLIRVLSRQLEIPQSIRI